MSQISVILHFDKKTVNKPIICQLLRNFDGDFNILHAHITPKEDGMMFVIMDGKVESLGRAFKFLEEANVRMDFPAKNLIFHEERCTHCGACVGQCLPKALSMEAESRRVVYDSSRCIACELCIPACGYGAIEPAGVRLLKKGGASDGEDN
jgi:ferredoxin